MKKLIKRFLIIPLVAILTTSFTYAQKSIDDNNIINVVDSYKQNLNGNNVVGLLKLFAEDGVIILQGTKTSIGSKEIELFYVSLFKTLDFELKFKIDEVVQMSSDWAFVRTTSEGTVTIISDKSDNHSEGHELFILKRQADTWKIARYAGSSAN